MSMSRDPEESGARMTAKRIGILTAGAMCRVNSVIKSVVYGQQLGHDVIGIRRGWKA